MRKSFWKGKKVLITGYEGFLGSNLTKALLACGALVWGLDIRTRRKQTILSREELRQIKIAQASVEDFPLLSNIIKHNKIAFVFHLAARALVEDCLSSPLRAFSTNIQGTWNLLEACRHRKYVRAVIIASSDKAYGSHKDLPYKEDTALSGRHPYDVSKSCADLLACAFYHTYKVPAVITRCGNIFGPGDFSFSRIVPDTIRSVAKNKALIIRSDGKFTRDYVYVDDVVNGYITLAEKLPRLKLAGQAFNFSCEKPISVLGLVKKVYNISARKHNYKILNRAKYEIKHQYLSSKKARVVLGWRPKINLEEGLKKTVAWYQEYLSK